MVNRCFRGRLGGSRQVAVGRRDERAATSVRGEDPRTREHSRAVLERPEHRARTRHVTEFDHCLDVIGLEAVPGRLALPLCIDERLCVRVLRSTVAGSASDSATKPSSQ